MAREIIEKNESHHQSQTNQPTSFYNSQDIHVQTNQNLQFQQTSEFPNQNGGFNNHENHYEMAFENQNSSYNSNTFSNQLNNYQNFHK
jgi:hypothetical protein